MGLFDTSVVFQANYNAISKTVINQGGTSSGKTYSIIQLLYYRAIEKKRTITVVGESVPNLKKGAYRDAETIYANSPQLQQYIRSWHKGDRIITFKNGSIMEFIPCLDEQSAKSGKRDILFINEANGISYMIYWQLAIRTREQIFLDYNPSARFWAHEKLIGTAGVQLIISDHRHNPFLSKQQHEEIENIPDVELHKVYARGRTGNITGIIYPNWIRIPDHKFPWDAPAIGGLDFGYTNDPTAPVRISRVAESFFIHELGYEPGLSPIQTKQLFNAAGINSEPIYCDHDPDQIAQLRRLGMTAIPAIKGKGSVNSGILFMRQQKVFYTESSINLHMERGKYVFIKDPKTGEPTNEPIDKFNHIMDSSRMACYTHYFRS